MSGSAHRPDVQPPLAIIVMGVSGSGKTTIGERLAERLDAVFVEGDLLHSRANVEKMRSGTPLGDSDRLPWLDRIGTEMLGHVASGMSVVASCSALKRSYRDRLRHVIGAEMRFVYLSGSRYQLEGRLAVRKGHFMPQALLESQLQTLEPPFDEPDVVSVAIEKESDQIVEEILTALC